MYQAAAAMTGNARWQEAISENLAAATVPGFKRTEVAFSSLASGFVPPGDAGSQIDQGMRYQLPSARGSTVFSAGEFQATGVPTHVAIEGDGFFSELHEPELRRGCVQGDHDATEQAFLPFNGGP
jgi:flagellar basal body rod protein FlgG